MQNGSPKAAVKKFSESCAPALFLGFGWRIRWRRSRRIRRGRFVPHALPELLDTLPQALHQFRDPASAKQNNDDNQDQQEMHRTEFHKPLPCRDRKSVV